MLLCFSFFLYLFFFFSFFQIFCCYGVSTFCLELLLRFDSRADHILSFVPFIGHLLPFEKIKLMHAWMPIVLNGLLLLGSELADTEDDFLDVTVRHVLDSHLEALLWYGAVDLSVAHTLILLHMPVACLTRVYLCACELT